MGEKAHKAATIVLLRNAPDLQTLMIERHRNMSFAGGAIVFPGGRVDPADHDPFWVRHDEAIGASPPLDMPARIAAIREAFEETGILLARPVDGPGLIDDASVAALQDWRRKIESDATLFIRMVEDTKLKLCVHDLQLFAHWAPPDSADHRRYDTLFYAAAAPAGQRAREDGNEATEALWIRPCDALDAQDRGERRMIFPTLRNVELLNVSPSAEHVLEFAQRRIIRKIVPQVVKTSDGIFVTIPDDMGYPITREPLETAMRS